MKNGIWKHSSLDFFLLAVSFGQLALTTFWAASCSDWTTPTNIALFVFMAFVFYFNPIVITHNFLHCPFFHSRFLNQMFSVINSANLSLPQELYKQHHLLHHRYSNDPQVDGTTKDPSSTYRFGRSGKHENVVSYSALSLFRDATAFAFQEAKKSKSLPLLSVQSIFVAIVLLFWGLLNWKWLVGVYLPLFLTGWFLAHMENYYEHYKASDPHSRFANSVSFYGRIYNILMFNEGFHQEHHISPQVHWTKRPLTRKKFKVQMEKARYYASKWPPLLGFLE